MREALLAIAAILIVVLALSATDISDWFAVRRKQRDAKRSKGPEGELTKPPKNNARDVT